MTIAGHDMGERLPVRRPMGTFRWSDMGVLKRPTSTTKKVVQLQKAAMKAAQKAAANKAQASSSGGKKSSKKSRKVAMLIQTPVKSNTKSNTHEVSKRSHQTPEELAAQQGDALVTELQTAMKKQQRSTETARSSRKKANSIEDDDPLDSLGMDSIQMESEL